MPTAIIADDERLMRDQLRMRLSEVWPELEIVGEAKNGGRVFAVGVYRGYPDADPDIKTLALPEKLKI